VNREIEISCIIFLWIMQRRVQYVAKAILVIGFKVLPKFVIVIFFEALHPKGRRFILLLWTRVFLSFFLFPNHVGSNFILNFILS